MASATVEERIESLGKELKALAAEVASDESHRKRLLELTRKTTASLETPQEAIWRIMFQPCELATIRTAIEMGILQALAKSKTPQTAAELAKVSGGDTLLAVRLLRVLNGMGAVRETAFETFAPTPFTETIGTEPFLGTFIYDFDICGVPFFKMPEYFIKTGFKNPEDSANGPFQYTFNTKLDFYPYLLTIPGMASNFNTFMTFQRKDKVDWFDVFPVDELLLHGFKENETGDAALIIDIAGGLGHDIQSLRLRLPDAPGRFVLQELPAVLDDIKELHPDIIRQPYDFLTPQPIKGARVYYYRSIFHNWVGAKAHAMLLTVAAAMTKGYSKLLINDWILPDENCAPYPAELDLTMLILFAGIERTRNQWTDMLGKAGLKVVKFHIFRENVPGLVEAELA